MLPILIMGKILENIKLSIIVLVIVNCVVLVFNMVNQYTHARSASCRFNLSNILNGCWFIMDRRSTFLVNHMMPRMKARPVARRFVILMFPLSVEIDLLHVKLMLLGDHVDLFWFGERVYSVRGKRKTLHFNVSSDLDII